MGLKIISLGTLVIVGAAVADVLSHGQTAVSLLNGFGNVWSTSIKTVAGQ